MRALTPQNRKGGFTLVELMVAMAVYSMLFAALAGGAIALQRSFSATEKYSKSVSDQSRILDYVARDVRRASAVAITQSSKRLDLTVPDQYANAAPSRTFRTPSVSMTAVTYGTTPGTISYYITGSNCIREEGGVAKVIATDVADFQLTFDNSDPSGKVVATTLTFAPKYQMQETASARSSATLTNRATLRK